MSDDEEIASDVPPRYLYFAVCHLPLKPSPFAIHHLPFCHAKGRNCLVFQRRTQICFEKGNWIDDIIDSTSCIWHVIVVVVVLRVVVAFFVVVVVVVGIGAAKCEAQE